MHNSKHRSSQYEDTPLRGWYRFFAPPAVPPTASLRAKESYLRGTIASFVGPLAFALALLGLPAATTSGNPLLQGIIGLVLLLQMGGMICNRLGLVLVGGFFVVSGAELGLVSGILTARSIDITTLSQYALLIQPVIFTVALLPEWYVFPVAMINLVVIECSFYLMPHSVIITGQGTSLTLTYLTLQIVVAVVGFLSFRMLRQAFRKADRTEKFNLALQENARLQREQLAEKQSLEEDVAAMIAVISRVLNMSGEGRPVYLHVSNSPLIRPLEAEFRHLLMQLQSNRAEAEQFRYLRQAVLRMLSDLPRWGQTFTPLERSGTELDGVILALNAIGNDLGRLQQRMAGDNW